MSKVTMPEPSIIAVDSYTEVASYGYDSDDMEAYAAAKVREALEEAAKACEAVGDRYEEKEGRKCPEMRSDAVMGCESCEDAVRALIK